LAEEFVLLEQHHIFDAAQSKMIGGRGAHDAATDDDYRCCFGKTHQATSVPMPSLPALATATRAASASCTATPTDFKIVICAAEQRPQAWPFSTSTSEAISATVISPWFRVMAISPPAAWVAERLSTVTRALATSS